MLMRHDAATLFLLNRAAARGGCRRSQSSVRRGEIGHGRAPLWSVWPLPKNSRFRPLYYRMALIRPCMHPLDPGMGPLRSKIGPCRSGMDPPNHAHSLFLWNVDSERLHHSIFRIEMGPQDRRGRGRIHPFLPLAAPLCGWVRKLSDGLLFIAALVWGWLC